MHWKEIIIGAVITLIITITGGVIVYYITQARDNPNEELLTYQVERQIAFEGTENNLSIGTLKFANVGSKVATNVIATLDVDSAKIKEFKPESENGASISSSLLNDNKTVTITIASLLPSEVITASYLLTTPSKVSFKLRSDKSVGSAGSIYKIENNKKIDIKVILKVFLPLVFIAIFLTKYFLPAMLNFRANKNNTAFVLLHKGATEDAISIFYSAISNGEDGLFALSNFATALAINGELERARIYLNASEIFASTKHQKSVYYFNSCIVSYFEGDKDKCIDFLNKSLELNKKAIKSYCKHSIVIGKIIADETILAGLKINPQLIK